MADPLGIIGVIGVSAQIIQSAVEFGLDWRDAPEDAKRFLLELQTLKTTLSETNTNVILNPSFVDSFRGRHSTLLSQLGPAAGGTDTQQLVAACQDELQCLLDDLRRRARGHRIGWDRLKAAFLAKRTRDAVQNLHRQCQALNGMLAIDAVALGASTHREVKEIRKEQQQVRELIENAQHLNISRETAEERKELLEWLAPIDYSLEQIDFISRRQPGTGQWLLESDEFVSKFKHCSA